MQRPSRVIQVAPKLPSLLHHGPLGVGLGALLLSTDGPVKGVLMHNLLDSGNSLVRQRLVLEHCCLLAPCLLVPSERGEGRKGGTY